MESDIVDSLLEAHERSGEAIDFLVASLVQEPRLFKITGCDVASGADRYWIGDADAANAFQSRLTTTDRLAEAPPNVAELAQWQTAFQAVVSDAEVETVAGFSFAVSSLEGALRYLEKSEVFYPNQKIATSNVPTPLRFGDSASGGYAYSVLVPLQESAPIVGVHLYQPQLGLLYLPLETDDARRYQNVSQQDFCRRVVKTFASR